MARVLKWLLIAFGAVVGLLLILVLVVTLLVDPNAYRGPIAEAVERQTGRKLTISGNLELTFFPRIGIRLGETRLADAPGYGQEPFARVQDARLAVQVMPLLGGELRVETVVLQGLQLRLIRNVQGEGNWESLAGRPAPRPSPIMPVAQQTPPAAPAPPAWLQDARLSGLRLEQADILWDDRQAGVRLRVQPLNLTLDDVQLGSPISVSADWSAALDQGPEVAGELAASVTAAADLGSVQVQGLKLDLDARGESVPGGRQQATLTAEASADLAQGVYRVRDLRLEAAAAALLAQVEARAAGADVSAQVDLEVPELNPQKVLAALAMEPVPTSDPEVLQDFSAQARAEWSGGVLAVSGLRAVLDDSTLTGEARVRDFAGPAASFKLVLDRMNVDRYLPPPAAEEPAPEDETGAVAPALPLEPLRTLALDGTLEVGALTVSGAQASDIQLTVTARDGQLRVHPVSASLYGGGYQGDLRLDARGDTPVVSMDEKLTGVQAGPLLTDLAGFEKLLGSADATLTATTRGQTPDQFLEALKGNSRFVFRNGAVKGINVAQTVRAAMARVRGQTVEEASGPQQTDFTELAGELTFDGGVVRNRNLDLKSPLVRVEGGGEANLLKQTLDYQLTVKVVGSLQGQGGAELDQLRGVPIPLRISGPLDDPSIGLDLAAALKTRAGQQVQQKAEETREKAQQKVEEKVKEKVGDKVQDRLKGLFN